MLLKDGLGSVLELQRIGGWVHIVATIKLKSLILGYVIQFGLTYLGWKWWKGRKRGKN